eukprot:m.102325 g.102325  ORF g.102325 m.102325 type:complete len:494 (-) comp15686_c0_seq1:143-1624(-)
MEMSVPPTSGEVYVRAPGRDWERVPVGICHSSRLPFRLTLLLLNSVLTFGCMYSYDLPSTTQVWLESSKEGEPIEGSEGLDFNALQYCALYIAFVVGSAIIVGLVYSINVMHIRVGLLFFGALSFGGTVVCALAAEHAQFWLMLLGRAMLGCGTGGLTLLQNRLVVAWFTGRALGYAFGFTAAVTRVGGVLNFLVSPQIVRMHGLHHAYWNASSLSALSAAAAVLLIMLHTCGLYQLGEEAPNSKPLWTLQSIRPSRFPSTVWLLCLCVVCFYATTFSFVGVACLYLFQAEGYTPEHSSFIAGFFYYLSVIVSPFMSTLMDAIGRRGWLIMLVGGLITAAFALLRFADVSPIVPFTLLGCAYPIAASSMWSSASYLLDRTQAGPAITLMTLLQMSASALGSTGIGLIRLDHERPDAARWDFVLLVLLCGAGAFLFFAIALNLANYGKRGHLNLTAAGRQRKFAALLLRAEAIDDLRLNYGSVSSSRSATPSRF